jgi:hypothetical protein
MPPIRSISAISDKWQRNAQGAQSEYQNGIANATKDWATNTAAAADSYNTGVNAAIAANRFATGVASAGTGKWKTNAMTKGPQRWAQGIRVSVDNYQRGFEPFRRVIESTTLPPRGPRGSAGNYERSRIMGEALNNARVGGAA